MDKGLTANISISIKDTKLFKSLMQITLFLYENATESIREDVAKRLIELGIDVGGHEHQKKNIN